MRRLAAILVAALLLGAVPATRGDGFVERRGGADPLAGEIERIDDAGVHVRTAGGRVVVSQSFATITSAGRRRRSSFPKRNSGPTISA